MSKYQPLTDYLKAQATGRVHLSFAEIEQVIGKKLPESAGNHRAWWSNNPLNNVMTRAWLDAGFESEQVDLPGRKLVFRRVGGGEVGGMGFAEAASPFTPSAEASRSKSALFGWLSGTVTIPPGVDLTEPADGEWAQLLAAQDEPAA